MKRKSTSLHTLTGDHGFRAWRLPIFLLYRLLNRLNNARPDAGLDPALEIGPFRCGVPEELLGRCAPTDSPTRKLCNVFWMQLPWEALQRELGAIHTLDVGCGDGRYYERLRDWSGGRLASYLGVDCDPRTTWAELGARHEQVRFATAKEREIERLIESQHNFIMTQSAIEHFPYDLEFFRQIEAYVQTRRDPVVQVHMFPAASGYDLFPIHGIRQYTPQRVSRITRLFSAHSRCRLYCLGGEQTIRVHREYVPNSVDRLFPRFAGTRPDQRQQNTAQYVADCAAAWRADMEQSRTEAAFYALVIHSHAREPLWD